MNFNKQEYKKKTRPEHRQQVGKFVLLALDSRLVVESTQNKKKMTTFSSDFAHSSVAHHNNNLGSLIRNGN